MISSVKFDMLSSLALDVPMSAHASALNVLTRAKALVDKPWNQGLCRLLGDTPEEFRLVSRVIAIWPEHSGHIGYPVSVDGKPMDEYENAIRFDTGVYGESRKRLLKFIIDTLSTLCYNQVVQNGN